MKVLAMIKVALLIGGFATYQFNRITSCGCGEIVDKIYLPAYKGEVEYYSIAMDAPMTREIEYPAKYILVLNKEKHTTKCEVSDKVYDTYLIGERISIR